MVETQAGEVSHHLMYLNVMRLEELSLFFFDGQGYEVFCIHI